ncbi:hypothetical protein Pint_19529 [Pistacia integerrima]|uniref:Uncharacterized protein n=1 Tax=Pistacia integerrima TaxID=434235 RepID=A0ACC0XGW6_9ROSI|nr:hypothetical protein Pint_19529 [Pistacia integerrima]
MASAYVFLLFFMIFQANIGQHKSKPISPGSSLSLTGGRISWDSPSGLFNFGFYKQGSGFSLGVWLLTSPEITIVWTANRDDPPLSSNATLELTTEGKLILKTGQNKDKLIANTMESAAFASMLDSGNFVLQNIHSDIIWSSFSLPTDTILGGQNLPAGSELFSRLSETNHSTGRFRLKMQEDGNLVLYPANTIDEYTEAYWASDTYRKQNLHLYLNFTGELVLVDNNLTEIKNLFSEPTLNKSSTIISRATVDVDGVFRLYYYFYVTEGVYNTTVKWKEPEDLCHVKTFCGLNSYCTLYDDQPICRCLPGTDFVDSSEMSGGCERSFVDQTCDVKFLLETKASIEICQKGSRRVVLFHSLFQDGPEKYDQQ